ncbi:LLM class flavin-dependent oxidoreductase [Psychrobacillus vulpis]|uniref:LLM class flavin-dependent oxidoreductase n=1 Tax=Psychrobacillus vulpis TaxID=2325572 RepID=A0A544TPJ3_9BACI|nr:LLM class flavin-dependent oxidoreductase [Psychrobacillus vulpis]TQR19371.1 LLM class flavin-dependent oxidoreductase [Psychrobacillus vulpis]
MKASTQQRTLSNIPLSVLDLSSIAEGSTARDAFLNSMELAQNAERLGYNRYWVAEHHNMPGVASSATSVLIGYLASGTSTLRIGAGGVMLPNHSPLVIAEQFGTLESLYPGRIDLGLGRAPGTDMITARALRRDFSGADNFPELVSELQSYFEQVEENNTRPVVAVPGQGLEVPMWLLGSSNYSAKLAGILGLPYSFASHFSPDYLEEALHLYRSYFKPSKYLEEHYVMAGLNVVAAETDEHAEFLSSSLLQQFLGLIRGNKAKIQPPVSMDNLWTEQEKMMVNKQLRARIVGSPEIVKSKLEDFVASTQVNEIMINSPVFDHQERIKSFELISKVANDVK